MTEIPNSILEQFMFCALRYALDRRTGVLTDILEYIEPYWGALNPRFQAQIKHDIERKIEQHVIHKNDMEACRRILAL